MLTRGGTRPSGVVGTGPADLVLPPTEPIEIPADPGRT